MMRHRSRRREVSPPPPPTRLLSWLAVAVLVHSALLLRSAVLTEGARAGPSSVFLDLARSRCLRRRLVVGAAPAAVGSETSSSATIRGAYPPARILFTTDDDDDDELYITYESSQGSPTCAAPNGPVVVYTPHGNPLRHSIPHGRATVA
uniref:Uncharacterized protein n=1 Tax=Ananas comosus var. bracteatus TaxID=296719 RepID=A0A6V7Q3V1_ANACO|nr:unnamed protein product [Ananas comosus var. bracteatus]